MAQTIRKSILASLTVFSGLAVTLIPTSSFANYYSYERCLNNGGGYIGCLGELADTMGLSGAAQEELNGLLEREKREQAIVLEAIKASESLCKTKEKAGGECYMNAIKGAKLKFQKQEAMKPVLMQRREAIQPRR